MSRSINRLIIVLSSILFCLSVTGELSAKNTDVSPTDPASIANHACGCQAFHGLDSRLCQQSCGQLDQCNDGAIAALIMAWDTDIYPAIPAGFQLASYQTPVSTIQAPWLPPPKFL